MAEAAKLEKPMSRGRAAGLHITLVWLFVLALVANAGMPRGNASGTAIRAPLIAPSLPNELLNGAAVPPQLSPHTGSACAMTAPAPGAALGAWPVGAAGIPSLTGYEPGGTVERVSSAESLMSGLCGSSTGCVCVHALSTSRLSNIKIKAADSQQQRACVTLLRSFNNEPPFRSYRSEFGSRGRSFPSLDPGSGGTCPPRRNPEA